MNVLRHYKISLRVWLLVVFSVIGIIAVTASSLMISRQGLMEEKFSQTRHSVEAVHSIVAEYHRRASAGEISVKEAQTAVLSVIEKIRYDDTNYFWINDMQPSMVMHPINPALNGKDLSTNRDPEGKRLFIEFVNVVKTQGEGHVPYLWPKPGRQNPVEKISFVKGFQPWGWIIGSGIYVDDVNTLFWEHAILSSGVTVFILLMLAIVSYLIIASITRPLNLTTAALNDIAEGQGDLSQRLTTDGADEITSLSTAFNTFVNKLQASMTRVESVSQQLSQASTQAAEMILAGNERKDMQNREIYQVATAVTEMSATVQEIASNAESAAVSAQGANTEAQTGMDLMQQTTDRINLLRKEINQAVVAVDELKNETINIGSVLDVIRSIAEQTNLLALNAAIEAARAGEQGRGFAVVADEVRTLASRTQESTQEIQQMIEHLQNGSRKAVEVIKSGCSSAELTVETANTAATTLKNIVQEVQNISQMNAHIASAAEGQTMGASEIDKSVNKISTLADETNEGNEQLVSATQNLTKLGLELTDLLKTFNKS